MVYTIRQRLGSKSSVRGSKANRSGIHIDLFLKILWIDGWLRCWIIVLIIVLDMNESPREWVRNSNKNRAPGVANSRPAN